MNDWKQEQLTAKRQQHEEMLAGEVEQGDDANTSLLSGADSAAPEVAPSAGAVVSERERALAKQRIAKWKADQAAKLEEEKVRFFLHILTLPDVSHNLAPVFAK